MSVAERLVAYVQAEIDYRVATALESHEQGSHEGESTGCRTERTARDDAERSLRSVLSDFFPDLR